MRIAYLDCSSGVSGDMLLAALLDAGIEIADLRKVLAKLDISGYSISVKKVWKGALLVSRLEVRITRHQHFRSYQDIKSIIQNSRISPAVKITAIKILRKLGQTEAKVHKCRLEEVHFHEIGAVDTIIDIVGTVWALSRLKIGKIYSSPVNVGSGTVRTAHGILPVPAPATAALLKNIPTYSSGIKQELATPTGAVLVSTLSHSFGHLPEMRVLAVGNSCGSREVPGHANLFRVIIGQKGKK